MSDLPPGEMAATLVDIPKGGSRDTLKSDYSRLHNGTDSSRLAVRWPTPIAMCLGLGRVMVHPIHLPHFSPLESALSFGKPVLVACKYCGDLLVWLLSTVIGASRETRAEIVDIS